MAFKGREEYPFMAVLMKRTVKSIWYYLPFFFSAVVANIEKHKLAVTGPAVLLAMTSAG